MYQLRKSSRDKEFIKMRKAANDICEMSCPAGSITVSEMEADDEY